MMSQSCRRVALRLVSVFSLLTSDSILDNVVDVLSVDFLAHDTGNAYEVLACYQLRKRMKLTVAVRRDVSWLVGHCVYETRDYDE